MAKKLEKPNQQATQKGVAIGGNVNGSQIFTGDIYMGANADQETRRALAQKAPSPTQPGDLPIARTCPSPATTFSPAALKICKPSNPPSAPLSRDRERSQG